MKLLITGSNGFVAGSVIAQAGMDWEVHGIAHSGIPGNARNVIYHQLDLLETAKLSALFLDIKPDVVIHAAAIANIDFCQQHKAMAEAINVDLTNRIAGLCYDAGIKMILCSTDAVFDGNRGNYREDDPRNPINYYAETKIRAEDIVLAAAEKNTVARLSLVMGWPLMGTGNSFLAEAVEKFKKGETVNFPENEIRTPIDVVTAGKALIELAGIPARGIIHLAGNTAINRFSMAKQIVNATGFSQHLILGTNSNAIPGRAPRANNASLNNELAKKVLRTQMLSLDEGLALTINIKKGIQYEQHKI